MGRLLRQHGVRGAAAQAAHFAARERRAGTRDPAAGLHQSHSFGPTEAFAPTSTFPNASRPLTIAVDMKITGDGGDGVLFEFGGTTAGTAFALDSVNGTIALVSGDARGGPAGVTARFTGFAFGSTTRLHRFVCALNPGRGTANLWWNGRLVAAAIAGGAYSLHDGDGGQFSFVSGLVNARLSAEAQVNLVNAVIIGRPRCYYGQVPQQMQHAGLGNDLGNGEWEN